MKDIGERIRKRREELEMSQTELASLVGYTSRSMIAKVEAGKVDLSQSKIVSFANALRTKPGSLVGWSMPPDGKTNLLTYPIGSVIQMGLLTTVRCGYGQTAEEEFTGEYESIPSDMMNGYDSRECRVFRVAGSSMYPKIIEGDKVLVHIQPDVESGEIAVIIYANGDESTLKKVVKHDDYLELIPANPEYQTKRFSGHDLAGCRIYGKVIKLIRDF